MNAGKNDCQRDQDATLFSVILTELCECTGARCAALVDQEGETVDYGGQGDPFDIRILAAEWRLVLQHLQQTQLSSPGMEIMVRARQKSFFVEALPEGYALVMQLARRATGVSERALSLARKRLCEEAGFSYDGSGEGDWTRVTVEEENGNSRRPIRMILDERSHEVTVLGLIHSAESARDRSFRVRLNTGEERTLVREPLGQWYLEEDPW